MLSCASVSSLPVPVDRALDRVRDTLFSRGYIRGIETLARLGRRLPAADPAKHKVRVIRDVAYLDDAREEHRLDVYLPRHRQGLLPVVLYIHGGAFHYLSKDTHWLMGLLFAARGHVVFNINYRLAPGNRFPAALEDVSRAAVWVKQNAMRYGGDPDRIAVAGESAGANLATALTVAACYPREEAFARELHEVNFVPRVCLPACGVLQVSDMARLWERRDLPPWVRAQLEEIESGYLPKHALSASERELCDPLLFLERGLAPRDPLPAFFTFVGTRDPLLTDTTRLADALRALQVPVESRVYRREVHAFHALWHRPAARDAWAGQIAYLRRYL